MANGRQYSSSLKFINQSSRDDRFINLLIICTEDFLETIQLLLFHISVLMFLIVWDVVMLHSYDLYDVLCRYVIYLVLCFCCLFDV